VARIIDLSKPIQYYPEEPFVMKVKIKHKSHKAGKLLLPLLRPLVGMELQGAMAIFTVNLKRIVKLIK